MRQLIYTIIYSHSHGFSTLNLMRQNTRHYPIHQLFFNKLKDNLILYGCLVLFVSCQSHEIAYINNVPRNKPSAILETYTSIITPGDCLYIYVASQNAEAVIPFNQETRTYDIAVDGVRFVDTAHYAQVSAAKMDDETRYISTDVTGYLVGQDGTIDFPLLGKIKIAGLTHDDLANILETRLKSLGFVKDPEITITLMNFRVTVVGEVKKPQQIHVKGTRLTLLEALAICGDLTDYGKRENVTIIRDNNGKQTYCRVDLTTSSLFESPFYYLHQNDIIYIEPNNLKQRTAQRDPNTPRYISIGVGIATSVNNIVRAITMDKQFKWIEQQMNNKM